MSQLGEMDTTNYVVSKLIVMYDIVITKTMKLLLDVMGIIRM